MEQEGPGACLGADFSIFSILETPQDRQHTIEIFENFDTLGIYGLGGRSEGYLVACRSSKISIFSIFPIENIEKIEAHRKKMFNGQD